jgi:tRNA pseudouridine55 synthase
MNGILIIDKPSGITSFKVIADLRKLSGIKRIGHGGTLDPLATGVLPIFFGKATRVCDILPNEEKTYKAEVLLGIETDTEDIMGAVISEYKGVLPSFSEIEKVVNSFLGEYDQAVPMYSAVSVGGKRLYQLAREGEVIEDRPVRKVSISAIKIDGFDGNLLSFTVSCKKGTYIRTLAADIGKALGCGATIKTLRRTYSAGFSIENAVKIEELSGAEDIEKTLLKTETAFEILPAIKLDEIQTKMFLNGVSLDSNRISDAGEKGRCKIFGNTGEFLGIADDILGELKIVKVLRGD